MMVIHAGTAIYLVSAVLITIFGNVPMNNRLAGMVATSPDTITYWRIYGAGWTNLNHLRMFGSLATAGCFLAASPALA